MQKKYIELTGNGFLYNMVRIIAGTLVEVGLGKIEPTEIPKIIESKNREKKQEKHYNHKDYTLVKSRIRKLKNKK